MDITDGLSLAQALQNLLSFENEARSKQAKKNIPSVAVHDRHCIAWCNKSDKWKQRARASKRER